MDLTLTDLFKDVFQNHIYPCLSIHMRLRLRCTCRKLRDFDREVVPPQQWLNLLCMSSFWTRHWAREFIARKLHLHFPRLQCYGVSYINSYLAVTWELGNKVIEIENLAFTRESDTGSFRLTCCERLPNEDEDEEDLFGPDFYLYDSRFMRNIELMYSKLFHFLNNK